MHKGDDILDRVHLARYTLGDAALEREVLTLFIDQIPQTVASLRGSDGPGAWLLAAHTIKGSARAVGAWKLAELAAHAEHQSERQELWGQLADEIDSAIADVRERIAVAA